MVTRRQFLGAVAGGACGPARAARAGKVELDIIEAALLFLGTPVAPLAPTFPRTTDCGRLTQWAYSRGGLYLPRTALDQYRACGRMTSRPGALIFFWSVDELPGLVTHVGIDLGGGEIIHADPVAGRVVRGRWADSPFWRRRYVAHGHLPRQGGQTNPPVRE